MRTRWISPQIIATNRIDAGAYGEVREMGRRVSEALGIGTAATHMEWFFGPKGLRFSEIGCRPPGVGQWDSYCAGNEFDLYREWALAVCHGVTDRPASRRYACGIVALRPERDGVIAGYRGNGRDLPPLPRPDRGEPLPRAGHPDAGGGGGLHGERLDAGAAPGL